MSKCTAVLQFTLSFFTGTLRIENDEFSYEKDFESGECFTDSNLKQDEIFPCLIHTVFCLYKSDRDLDLS